MRLSRRSFLKSLAAVAAVSAAGIALPTTEAVAALIPPEVKRNIYAAAVVAPQPPVIVTYPQPFGLIYQLKPDKVNWEPHVNQTHPFREGGALVDQLWSWDSRDAWVHV